MPDVNEDTPIPRSLDRVDRAILQAIRVCYNALEPEALTGDGELPRSVVEKRHAVLTEKLEFLQDAFGRPVSATACFRWQLSERRAKRKTVAKLQEERENGAFDSGAETDSAPDQ